MIESSVANDLALVGGHIYGNVSGRFGEESNPAQSWHHLEYDAHRCRVVVYKKDWFPQAGHGEDYRLFVSPPRPHVHAVQHATYIRSGIAQSDVLLRPALERLAEIEGLKKDWDPYGSEAPSPISVNLARALLHSATASEFGPRVGDALLPLHIAPIADGGVQLEWSTDNSDLEVYVSPQGVFSVLLIDHKGHSRQHQERSNVTMPEVLDELRRALDTPVSA